MAAKVHAAEAAEPEDLVTRSLIPLSIFKRAPKEEEEPEEEEKPEIEDPQQTLKDECGSTKHCEHFKNLLDECEGRVSGKENTTETCQEELFDFLHCVDHCVSQKLFDQLK